MTSFRLHGRSGQGIRTAGRLLAKSCFSSGFNAQCFFYPSETGYPAEAHIRIDKKPIITKEPVREPDYVLIMDMGLDIRSILSDIKDGTVIILNSQSRKKLVAKKKTKQYSIDATGIAAKNLKKSMPNTAVLGALARIYANLSIKSLKKSAYPEPGGNNSACIDEGYKGVKQCG